MSHESLAGPVAQQIVEVLLPDCPSVFFISDRKASPYLVGELTGSFASEAEARDWWLSAPHGLPGALSGQVLQVQHHTEKEACWSQYEKALPVNFALPLDELTERIDVGLLECLEGKALLAELSVEFKADPNAVTFQFKELMPELGRCITRPRNRSDGGWVSLRVPVRAEVSAPDCIQGDSYLPYLDKHISVTIRIPFMSDTPIEGSFRPMYWGKSS